MTASDTSSATGTANIALRVQVADLHALLAWLDTEHQRQHDTLAAELHDQLGSSLTALAMRLALIARQSRDTSTPGLTEQWNKSNALLGTISATARQVQLQLRPVALEALGLQATLADYLDQFGQRTGVACSLEHGDTEPALALAAAQALFRILQEVFANIERHAGARQVRVVMTADARHCSVRVSDDGCGFDLATLDWQRSHGLRLMRERAALLRAQLDIDTQPGQGCAITITLSLPA